MTLGDIIKDYRKKHDLSMDAFSEKSGISKAYISLLEKNKHPKTGKNIAPSIQCIKQAADGMNMDFNVLFGLIDGNVTVGESIKKENIFNFDSDPDVRRIQRARQKMPEEDRAFMMQMLKRSFGEYFEDDSSDDPD
ncbi:MAG: helix-turn-helix transcriptional regulator [Lachnospiraceae bacterium]|nr:helix-turn-helix transcriptional regulator [Lachnospiraceae bacterium]MCI9592372.1 helix-turn-helix transcriptional regulator [Lachnospiraceae bacterium]